MQDIEVDILEDKILTWDKNILKILLEDKTSKKNIIWATSDYENLGEGFLAKNEIKVENITGLYSKVIQPRISKEKSKQNIRTKDKAEVFTPSWVCNIQNNLVDEQWFNRKDIFNISKNKKWITNTNKIKFLKEKNKLWTNYVDLRRMEISCGEAPYLVSRYDTVTGKPINVEDRIGMLDRKIRIINENINNNYEEWFKYVKRAYESIYGYEYQGDNLLIARENLLYTFLENCFYKFKKYPTIDEIKKVANIISWNIWQMDGTNYCIPHDSIGIIDTQLSLFEVKEIVPTKEIFCKIRDWRANKTIEFISIMGGV